MTQYFFIHLCVFPITLNSLEKDQGFWVIWRIFPIAKLLGLLFALSPIKPITLDQVRLLEKDNILPKNGLGFKDLDINPSSIISLSDNYLKRYISKY